jgi:stage II sporulation protein AA (anti-sigma F factor antagonist)
MAAQRLAIDVIPTGHAVTLMLHGPVEAGTVGALRACLEHLDTGWSTVILDMRGVTFLDSGGVAVLLNASLELDVAFRRMELCHVDDAVQRVLELSGATDVIPIVRPAAALGAWSPGLPHQANAV